MRRLLSMLLIATASVLGLSACEAPEPTMMDLVKVPGDAGTITEALRLVTSGGVIMVAPGRYLEQVEINKPDVTIRGEDRNLTIIDGEGIRPFGIAVTADGVRIENLTVIGATAYGVIITGIQDLSELEATGEDDLGQWLPASMYTPLRRYLVDHVTAANNGRYGIAAVFLQHGEIKNSNASGSETSGILLAKCEQCDAVVIGNVAERNAIGFEVSNANDTVVVVGNRFSGNRIGAALRSDSNAAFAPQHGNLLMGDLISDNGESDSPPQNQGLFGIGILISGGQTNGFFNNRISGNPQAAIVLDNYGDIAASGNQFDNNEFGEDAILANISADTAPARDNCITGISRTVPPTLIDELEPACQSLAVAGASVTLSGASSIGGPPAPTGVEVSKVRLPRDQPQLEAPVANSKLPLRVPQTDISRFLSPSEDFLSGLAGHK
ncbi:MAG: right-handed parallel beta-helix repeat-containing protein [Microbacteriaceae bacterium]|nr:right-handed parallel beta-helix repeat-containing protein [Microbacteriaceae bacterium]